MRTIREGAVYYQKGYPAGQEAMTAYCAFFAGAEFAQRWIPVEEEMPEFSEENMDKCFLVKGYFVFDGKRGGDMVRVSTLDPICYEYFNKAYFKGVPDSTITHWRYIDLT